MNKEANSSSSSNGEAASDNPDISDNQSGNDGWDKVNTSMNSSSVSENLVNLGELQNSSENTDSFVVVDSLEEQESGDDKFTITVRPLNGRDLTVMASPTSTIRQLKLLIEAKSGIEAANQRLIFRGRCMLDDDTVDCYIKENGVIIHLVPYVRNQTTDNTQASTTSRARTSSGSNSSNNFQNIFSGTSNLNSSMGGFPGAMMFGAIRLDGDTGIPIEAEDLMQRVLRSFGEAVANTNVEPNLNETSTQGNDLRNLNTINLSTFGFGQPSIVSTFSGSNTNSERANTNNRADESNGSGVVNSDVNNSQINNNLNVQSNINNSDQTRSNLNSDSQSVPRLNNSSGNNRASNANANGNIRAEHINSNPIGRIGTIVSRIFQAFNQPVTDIIREGNIAERRRINQNSASDSNSNNANILNSSIPVVNNERVNSNSNNRRSEGNFQDSATRTTSNPSALNWTQFTTPSSFTTGRTGLLPIGRPGLAVATIPISNLSIPITIRTTSSTGIPTINLSSGSNINNNTNDVNRFSEGVTNANNTSNNSTIRTSSNNNTDNNSLNNSNQVNDLYRVSSESFFKNISNILEDSASQLQTVASSIREMSGISSSSSSNTRDGSSFLPPIPSIVTRSIDTSSNVNSGNVSDYIQHHSHRLYISNELVHRFLPWDSLNELLNIAERDTGWRRPRITIPPPIDSADAGPLAIFISVFLQAMSIVQANLMQIQAWQERFARLDVPRLCYTVHLLTLISHISAHLSSLLAWLFHNMAQYVEQDRLLESLQWNKIPNEDVNKEFNTTESSNSHENSQDRNLTGSIQINECVNKKDDDMIIEDSDQSRDYLIRHVDNIDTSNVENNSDQREDKRMKRNTDVEGTDVHVGDEDEDIEVNQQTVINYLPQEVKEKWQKWTSDSQNFSKNIFASFSTRSFSDTYQRGDVFSSSSRFNFTQSSNSTKDESTNHTNSQPTSQDLFRMIIHQTEANLNITPSCTRNYSNLQNEYRAMLVRDLVRYVRSDSDFINDQDRFPYLQKVFSILDNNST